MPVNSLGSSSSASNREQFLALCADAHLPVIFVTATAPAWS